MTAQLGAGRARPKEQGVGSQPHWGGSQLLPSWREWPGQLSRNSPRSRWGASVHYRWKNIGRLQCRISLHPTTEIPDPGLGLLDLQLALHRPLHSSLLSKNPQASNSSASHHTSEVERAGFIPSHRQNTGSGRSRVSSKVTW